jgi:hypothetical protein
MIRNGVPVKCETKSKRNETKPIETKRNQSKRSETNRNETKPNETKPNQTKIETKLQNQIFTFHENGHSIYLYYIYLN